MNKIRNPDQAPTPRRAARCRQCLGAPERGGHVWLRRVRDSLNGLTHSGCIGCHGRQHHVACTTHTHSPFPPFPLLLPLFMHQASGLPYIMTEDADTYIPVFCIIVEKHTCTNIGVSQPCLPVKPAVCVFVSPSDICPGSMHVLSSYSSGGSILPVFLQAVR